MVGPGPGEAMACAEEETGVVSMVPMVQAGGVLPRHDKVTMASCWLPWCGSPAPP